MYPFLCGDNCNNTRKKGHIILCTHRSIFVILLYIFGQLYNVLNIGYSDILQYSTKYRMSCRCHIRDEEYILCPT